MWYSQMGLMVVPLGVLSYDVFSVFPLVAEPLWGYRMVLGMEGHLVGIL